MPQVPTLFIRDNVLYETVELKGRLTLSVDALSPPLADRYVSSRMRFSVMTVRNIFDWLS